ncbi:hypothetical protein M9H77_35539 [Catharanthus roseus]|uniref:Uncharacterized protein n=1 Tax=Catharanthus roseus TaxID=4058 RepID=A0ACB9ZPA8_CATRO|nr:hypothetical protein M9H77_35539 [Catharanthus roseus]
MATSENWQFFVHDGRHNHAIGVYHHGHAQATRLTEEQLIQIEQFRKSHMPPQIIQRPCEDEEENDTGAQHGRRSSSFKCSTGLYRFKFKFMMYSLYNMLLLEAIRMTPTDKNFTIKSLLERRMSPSWYMRWFGRRPWCTRSTQDVRGTMTPPHTTG